MSKVFFFEHDEGIDGVVSFTMKMEVVAPTRYGLEDQCCLPSTRPVEFFLTVFSCLGQVFFLSHCGPCTALPSSYPVSPCQKKRERCFDGGACPFSQLVK